ncbi:MAG: amidohydrolase [Anaerolineales bacterium]|nr:MAG: amidohydrolase [Anaerolineales bacterium]
MRIDAHQHYWRYSPAEYKWIGHPALMHDFMPEDLIPLLAGNAFDGTVAVQARSTLQETQWLMDLAEQYTFIKGVVGWLDLCDPGITEILTAWCANPLFCGVRTGIRVSPVDAQQVHKDFLRGMALLGEFNTTFDILISPVQLPLASCLVEKFPSQVFVLDHIANPPIKDQQVDPWDANIHHLASFPNVFCKVSGMVTRADHEHWHADDFRPYLDIVFEAFGPDRLMIGSDWPVCTQAATYQQTMDIVIEAVSTMTQVERDAVLGGTAVRAYHIQR